MSRSAEFYINEEHVPRDKSHSTFKYRGTMTVQELQFRILCDHGLDVGLWDANNAGLGPHEQLEPHAQYIFRRTKLSAAAAAAAAAARGGPELGGAGIPGSLAEDSIGVCRRILHQDPGVLPPSIQQLPQFLRAGLVPFMAGVHTFKSSDLEANIVYGTGMLARVFTSLVDYPPLAGLGHSEEVTSQTVFQFVLQAMVRLNNHAGQENAIPTLVYDKNKSVTSASPGAHDPSAVRCRPDTIIVAGGLLVYFGEEKDECQGLHAARADVDKKFPEGLSPCFYHDIPYILFHIAAGTLVQLGALDQDGEITMLGNAYDLANQVERLQFLMAIVQVHKVLRSLLSMGPSLEHRALQMVSERRKGVGEYCTMITRHKGHVTKEILSFSDFTCTFGHTLDGIQEAYRVANGCRFMVCTLNQELPELHSKPQHLPHAPKKQKTDPYYKVQLGRLGYPRAINDLSEGDMQQAVHAALHSVAVLAKAGLVHTDIRLANILWDYNPPGMPFVCDLEQAAKAPFTVKYPLKDWTEDTLQHDNGQPVYVHGSDVYQIGVMLDKWWRSKGTPSLEGVEDLYKELTSHKREASALLSHRWVQCSCKTA